MEEIQKLYDVLVRDGYYTKTFEEFTTQFEDPSYQDKVFGVVSRDGLYTKDKESFINKYSLKKKGGTVSVLGDGSLEQPTITQPSTGTQDSTIEFSDVEYEDPELKMNVLDLAQQLPTLNYNELNEEGQQYVTETASKYGLSEDQILAQARTKKAAINRAGVTDFLYNAYKKGDARLGEGIVSIPSVLFEGAALISDPINRALGRKETNLEAFEEAIGTRPVLDALIDEQEYRQKQAQIYKKERKIEGGIAENFFESGNIADGFLLLGESIAESAPVSVGIMAASASGIGLIPLAAGATTVMTGPELRAQKEQFPEQSDFTNVMKAIGMAGAEMVFSTISQGTLGKVYRDIIFRQGAEAGRKTFKKGLISMYETAIRKTGPIAAGLGEGIEESATQITQNLIDGRPAYEGVPDAFLAGLGSGGVYGAPISGIKGIQAVNKGIAKRKISKKIKNTEFDDITKAFESDQTTDVQLDLVETKRADEVLVTELKNKVDKGELTQEQADNIQQNYFDTAVGNVKVKPLNLTSEQKTKAIDLLKEKRALTEAINEIDDSSLSVAQQERLNEVNDELSNLVKPIKKEEDAVQEPSSEEVDVQKQTRDGEEVGVGDTTGDITTEITSEEIETTEVPKEEVTELTEEQKDEVSDLEYSLSLKPQKTKQKKESPVDIFFGETIEDTTESLSDNLVINKKDETVDKTPEQVKQINSVTKIATTAAKAISKLLPNTRIVLHDSTTEFQKYVTTSEAEAEYNPSDNVIHVDLSKATDITVPHEIFHAVFLGKVKTDQKATRQADLLVKKLQAADLPSEVKERLDSFVKKYTDSPGTRNEEKLAELMGILAEDYSKVNDVEQNMIRNFLKQLARLLGLRQLENTINTDNEVLNLLNTLAQKVVTGEEITETDVEILEQPSLDTEQEQGSGGQVGTFDITPRPRQRKAPGIETDTRGYASLIQEVDLKDFQGQSFVTNMYDFTSAGPTEIAPGIVLQLDGGKSYVPMMMERQGLKLGDKSNLAAFNSKENAESFARNAQGSASSLFAPHVGTKEGSWQFQQNLLEQLTDAALNNNILTNKELINTFNEGLKSKDGIKSFNIFKKKLGKDIKNLNSFIDNPTRLIELLDINNNYSPDLRKILNDKLSANKKYQERIGVKNKLDFVSKFEDPLNKGSQGGDLVGLIEFDNNTFEISKPKKGDVDYHPSFAYTIKANINGIYQPTDFYQSNDATETYAKYNKKGKTVSEKAKVGEEKFRTSNVSSSAGAIPKVGTVTPRQRRRQQKIQTGKPFDFTYKRNTEKAPQMGSVFGQDVEPSGIYVTQVEQGFVPQGLESGEIQIQNPLVIDITSDTLIEYKRDLSKKYNNKKGRALTEALKADGYDAVVTKFKEGDTGEIILLNSDINTYKRKAPKPRQRLAPIEGEEITIEAVVEQGRAQGFSDTAIKAVLIGRGFKASDINTALEVSLKKGETLPTAFRAIPDGLSLFKSLRSKINRFKNTPNRKTKEKPSNAEVRAKALDILQNTQEYKDLPENQQNELVLAIDKFVGSRANKTIQREITRIKNLVKGFKKGVKDLRRAQIELKNFIRTAMPKSQGYSETDIANAIAIVTGVKSANDLPAAIERVIKKVETARERKKKSLITKLQKFVSSKAKVLSTGSKRRKSKGLDAQGQQFFSQVNQILKAALGSNAINRMAVIANELSDIERYNKIIAKEARGEKLTIKESKFLDKSIAFEMFTDIKDKSLEEVEALFEDLQSGAEISRKVVKEKRIRKAEKDARLQEQVTSQIKKDFGTLFKTDKNGKKVLKSIKEIRADIKEINKSFAKLKIWQGLKELYKNYDFTAGKNISAFFRTKIAHLGSLTRILDNYSLTGFFQEQVYDRLNIMSENSLKGKFYQQKIIDSIADSVEGIEGGYSGVLKKLQKIGIVEITEDNKKVEYTADQIMRMYALSLNDVQRERLRNEGIKNIEEIKDILGPELVSFTDKIVEYLSNDYFESLNDVYSDVNDTNLGYVENYFPTASISDADQARLIDGDFNSVLGLENASSLKERTAKDLELNLEYGFSYTLENYINSMERYKSYASGTRELNTIFNTEAVKTLIDKNVLDVGDLIKTSINYEINPTYGLRNEIKDSTRKVFSWFTSYSLSFKFIQIPKQMTSFVNAFSEHQFRTGKYTPVIDTLSFLAEYALVLANFRSNLKKMKEVSATFRERLEKGLEGDIHSLESGGLFQYLPETSAKATRLRRNFRKAAASPTVLGDVLGVMGYVANYNRNIKNGMSQAEALKAFNNYNATQQSRRNTEKSPIQRAKGYNRVFTSFGSTLFLQMNRVALAQRNIFAKHLLKGKVPPTRDIRDLALNLSIANALFVATSNIAKLWAGDDEDRKEVYLAIGEAAIGLNLLYQIPLFGAAAEQMVQRAEVGLGLRKRVRTFSPIVNPFNAFWFKLNRFIKDPTYFGAIKGVIDGVLGVQTDPAVGVINLFKDMEADEGEIYDFTGISKSYRPSDKKTQGPPPD